MGGLRPSSLNLDFHAQVQIKNLNKLVTYYVVNDFYHNFDKMVKVIHEKVRGYAAKKD